MWARPTWDVDRWIKDGDDAVVRLELPGVDVAKDVNVEVDRGQLVIHGERRDERSSEHHAAGSVMSARSGTDRFAGRSSCLRTSAVMRSRRRTTPAS